MILRCNHRLFRRRIFVDGYSSADIHGITEPPRTPLAPSPEAPPRPCRRPRTSAPGHVSAAMAARAPSSTTAITRYRDLLAEHCRTAGVEVWAWCLMPNQVHLILVPSARQAISLMHCHRNSTLTGRKSLGPLEIRGGTLAHRADPDFPDMSRIQFRFSACSWSNAGSTSTADPEQYLLLRTSIARDG